ncbi:MAG: hypothetical protein ABIB46_05545, partial [bacterium]
AGVKSGFLQSKNEKLITSQKISNSSFAEIENMLKRIEKKNAPAEKMGAMCYKMAMPPKYQEYVCPIDGEKTVYSRENMEIYNCIDDIVKMRRLIEHINSVTNLAKFTLDEKQLCHICCPNIKTNERYISLIIKYPDNKEYRYNKVITEDLQILKGFFEKKLDYEGDRGSQIPLKEEIKRIKKILGIEISIPEKENKK